MKSIITISVDKTTTESEIKAIREKYSKDGYIVNIVKSGYKDNKQWLSEFISARLKT